MNTLNIHQPAKRRVNSNEEAKKVNFIHTKKVKRMRGLRNSFRLFARLSARFCGARENNKTHNLCCLRQPAFEDPTGRKLNGVSWEPHKPSKYKKNF